MADFIANLPDEQPPMWLVILTGGTFVGLLATSAMAFIEGRGAAKAKDPS
jgi:hypothetical protein